MLMTEAHYQRLKSTTLREWLLRKSYFCEWPNLRELRKDELVLRCCACGASCASEEEALAHLKRHQAKLFQK